MLCNQTKTNINYLGYIPDPPRSKQMYYFHFQLQRNTTILLPEVNGSTYICEVNSSLIKQCQSLMGLTSTKLFIILTHINVHIRTCMCISIIALSTLATNSWDWHEKMATKLLHLKTHLKTGFTWQKPTEM